MEAETAFGRPVRIYDKERTICDIVRNRNVMDTSILYEDLQMKDFINNLSKKKGITNQALFTSYMMERLLEKIALSKYKDNFILKGGVLVAALIGVDMRTTMDIDATLKGYPLSKEDIEKAFSSILSVEVDDGIEMIIKSIDRTRDEDEYGGLRISFDAKMDKMKIPFKVDITTDDKIKPKEVKFKIPLLLGR